MAFKIYSIESRKGGVGKTTVALNLGRALLSKGPVLLLDCDFTGTSCSEPANKSEFWQNYCNVCKDNGENYANLLDYFLTYYLSGKDNIKKWLDSLNLARKKVNVIGSDLYRLGTDVHADSRLLYDELHSYWFVEMVQQISEQFSAMMGVDVFVILDNAPGYIGFAKALHTWMGELGPTWAHYVFVSSVDSQDIAAVMASAYELNQTEHCRLEIRRAIASPQEDIDIPRILKDNDELKGYYYNQLDLFVVGEEPRIDLEEHPVSSYMTLIINKVPEAVRQDHLDVDYVSGFTHDEKQLYVEIAGADSATFIPQNLIYYSEEITLQYIEHHISDSRKKQTNTDDLNYWNDRYRSLEKRLTQFEENGYTVKHMSTLSTLYRNLIKSLQDKNYRQFSNRFPRAWDPNYAVGRLNEIIAKLGRSVSLVEGTELSHISKREWSEFNTRRLGRLTSMGKLSDIRELLRSLKLHIEAEGGISNDTKNPSHVAILSVFWFAFISRQIKNYNGNDYRQFLISEYQRNPYDIDWKAAFPATINVVGNEFVRVASIHVLAEETFVDFYKAMCYLLIRVMDAVSDFRTILSVIKMYVPVLHSQPLPNNIRDYISLVVVSKLEVFQPLVLVSLFKERKSMDAFQQLIKNSILNRL